MDALSHVHRSQLALATRFDHTGLAHDYLFPPVQRPRVLALSAVKAHSPAGAAVSPITSFFITGTTVVLEMTSGGLFMENVKMEKQRTSLPYPTIMRRILGQGLKGFEAGLLPWGLILGFTKGSVIGGSKVAFCNKFESMGFSPSTSTYMAGPLAGSVQGIFMAPILLARTRVNQALTERAAQSVSLSVREEMAFSFGVLTDLVRKEGFMALTTGLRLFMFKRAFDWGTRFALLTYMRDWMKEYKAPGEKLTNLEKLGTAFGAGALSVLVTVPVDRLAPVVQAANSEAAGGLVTFMKRKIAAEGPATIFRGFWMRTVHTGYHTAFAIYLADIIQEQLMSGVA